VLDFTSALYLGLLHAQRDLQEWDRLTLGKPAALESTPLATAVEARITALTGRERALLGTSTLHLFWDLFAMLSRSNVNIFLDEGSYPVAQWGVSRAASLGSVVYTFRRHDIRALKSRLRDAGSRPPVIVADGFCPGCGRLADLGAYVEEARTRGGVVVIDDSQALGIFGTPSGSSPYGAGGGGSLRHAGLGAEQPVVLVASLAKAFGVPIAVIAGEAGMIDRFEAGSATRVHCSPPSAAAVTAASAALRLNRLSGDRLRRRLLCAVGQFQRGLRRIGLSSQGGVFPVQSVNLPLEATPAEVHGRLLQRGVRALLHRMEGDANARISFVLTARHTAEEIDRAIDSISDAVRKPFTGMLERSYAK
jgi:8-amino-7-oxononanoate synthase